MWQGVTGLTCAVHVVHLGVAKEPLVSEVSLCGGETRLALVNRLQHTPVSAQVSSPALASCHDGATPHPPEGERGGGRESERGGGREREFGGEWERPSRQTANNLAFSVPSSERES